MRGPDLAPGELLSTFLVRTAHRNGLEPWRFCNLHWPSVPVWSRDVDRSADPAWLAEVAGRLRIPEARLRAATLLDIQVALGAHPNGSMPLVLAAGIHHRARHRHGLQYCPDCLAERPMLYRRAWRFAIAVTCPDHGRPLRDACPHCDAPLAPHRNDRLNWDLCHACGGYLVYEPPSSVPGNVPARVTALQASLLPSPRADGPAMLPGAIDGARSLRAMLGVLATGVPVDRLAAALGLPPLADDAWPSGVFERRRHGARVATLDLVAAWRANWPDGFRIGAAAIGLTARPFAVWHLDPELAEEVARLPDRARPQRASPRPLIHTNEMRDLRRGAPPAYRRARAQRLDALSPRRVP